MQSFARLNVGRLYASKRLSRVNDSGFGLES